MSKSNEFREIGHSGGQFTVTSTTEADGHRAVRLSVRQSNPTQFVCNLFQVNLSGEVLGVAAILGETNHTDANSGPAGSFPIILASDREGMFGHQCPRCGTYWRSEAFPAHWPMTCTRCGLRQQSHGFLTDGQRNFIGAVLHKVNEAVESEVDGDHTIDMDTISDDVQNGAEVPTFYYAEESQQFHFRCMACGSHNDILGKYGHCSCCGCRNNLKIIQDQISENLEMLESGSRPEDCTKLLVSIFDSCAKSYLMSLMERTPLTPARQKSCGHILFHNADRAPELIRAYFDIRLLKGLKEDDIRFLKLMFHRRHVFEHRGGVVDQRYLDETEDGSVRLGQSLRETTSNVKRFGELLKKMAKNFDAGYHQIFPPDETALRVCGHRVSRS